MMDSSIVWISEDLALAIHDFQLAQHGGMQGVRDIGLLSSALARPKNLWAYSSRGLRTLCIAPICYSMDSM
jgi:death-on-curing protein